MGRHNTEIQALVGRLNNLHEIFRVQAEILSDGEKVVEPLGALLDAIRSAIWAGLGLIPWSQVLRSFLSCDLPKYGLSERGAAGFHIERHRSYVPTLCDQPRFQHNAFAVWTFRRERNLASTILLSP